MNLEEFLKLPEEKPKRCDIPWPAVLKAILHRPVTVSEIQQIVKDLTGVKPFYTQITSWLNRRKNCRTLVGDVEMDIVVLKRYRGPRVYYLVTTPEVIKKWQEK